MFIAVLTLDVSLPGCASLKEKRQRMGGIHERFGRHPAVAVCESGQHDRLEASEWTFVVTGNERQKVESLCSEIEDKLQRTVDGRVLKVSREML
ncbi:MAG: DUF503 domain-containing protein [Billgrantia sp.]|uniref:DUF503 domain-containing protein n=1 Tax=Billgrantia desiderata TaxID=52021 RepID=A0ABS9B832_9GAMM|nr:DUF503 domain-containing protein [Halomonas desiderata]MCE8012441.1 DUF503 domain-containing protein [Halomonas desiderata]MCE8043334.1 DUF503 domain-containing protein [Halomonas desiderata]MCE8047909.1 DUF503 domain-containing protein [Halomonas desiderata]OUE41001.1 hypothetical protein BZY95_12810 [Halomonas desiderata SP1]SEF86210.1 hypothetical protein SAMN04487953_10779 [Halomonas desiderata]